MEPLRFDQFGRLSLSSVIQFHDQYEHEIRNESLSPLCLKVYDQVYPIRNQLIKLYFIKG